MPTVDFAQAVEKSPPAPLCKGGRTHGSSGTLVILTYVEKHAVTPAKAGVQCSELNIVNGFWTPASAGVTVLLENFTFFDTLLTRKQP